MHYLTDWRQIYRTQVWLISGWWITFVSNGIYTENRCDYTGAMMHYLTDWWQIYRTQVWWHSGWWITLVSNGKYTEDRCDYTGVTTHYLPDWRQIYRTQVWWHSGWCSGVCSSCDEARCNQRRVRSPWGWTMLASENTSVWYITDCNHWQCFYTAINVTTTLGWCCKTVFLFGFSVLTYVCPQFSSTRSRGKRLGWFRWNVAGMAVPSSNSALKKNGPRLPCCLATSKTPKTGSIRQMLGLLQLSLQYAKCLSVTSTMANAQTSFLQFLI